MSDELNLSALTPTISLRASVWKTMSYFDVFQHPLHLREITTFVDVAGVSEEMVKEQLNDFIGQKLISESAGYYYLGSDKTKVRRRLEGNIRACKKMRVARIFSRIISFFPYTRAVMISGSMSKGVMHQDSDIDFFVISKPGRLWLNRTLLALFKKIFLLNSHKYFCINYFIDEDHLAIPDRNIFTATEIAFLMPMSNYQLHQRFLAANQWYAKHYPNLDSFRHQPDPQPLIRRIAELPFNNGLGDRLESLCMKLNNNYWRRKYHLRDLSNPDSDIYSTPHTSKYHPNRQQFIVLEQLEQRLNVNI
jgi:hypothetical protein